MAITFESAGQTMLIGGQETLGGGSGFTGPFPRYSISREEITTSAGVYLHSKFTINITGTATIAGGDMTVAGDRQGKIMTEAKKAIDFNRNAWPMLGEGKLDIEAYGSANNIIFHQARLVNVELPEQSEESAGTQFLEYAFTFEATKANSGTQPTYLLNSAEESWELSYNEGQVAFANSAIGGNEPKKTYTLTHTVSATGSRKTSSPTALDADGEAWRQASQYVATRLVNNPLGTGGRSNIINDSTHTSNFNPSNMDKNGVTDLGVDFSTGSWKAFNHARQWSSDHAAGSCSVTDTWLISDDPSKATHDVEVSLEVDQEAPANTVTVSVTVQGLSTKTAGDDTENKYDNALASIATIKGLTFTAANSVYGSAGLGGTLRATAINTSEGHTKSTGTITYSVTYDDLSVSIPGAIREDITVTYDNNDQSNQVVAIIGVIDNAGGPVIQDMDTTTEGKVSVSIDATMDKSSRTNPPTAAAEGIANGYLPPNGFQQSKTETWSPVTGQYNLSKSWTFTT